MYEWEFFDVAEPRPVDAFIFTEAERSELEVAVSESVAALLSRHGKIVNLDPPTPIDIAEGRTESFDTIELESIELDDESEVVVFQMSPDDPNNTEPGVHHIEHLLFDVQIMKALVCHDPSQNMRVPIYYESGTRVELGVLQELLELLDITLRFEDDSGDEPNYPPIDTSLYPRLSVRGYREFVPPANIEELYPRHYFTPDRELAPPKSVKQQSLN